MSVRDNTKMLFFRTSIRIILHSWLDRDWIVCVYTCARLGVRIIYATRGKPLNAFVRSYTGCVEGQKAQESTDSLQTWVTEKSKTLPMKKKKKIE